ncbi:MAG: cbb3-type cytochrome oxidase assembly protein CcoS [Mucispirillum sp.]|nr:cbb3-type cytochrome oxidase assembly protein CcoS [Mucispirillum sp.]
MKSLFILIIISLTVGISGFAWFMFAGRHKQFDDIEGPKYRMLNDDDDEINSK